MHRWKKLGLVFQPDSSRCWMRSHAAVPTPLSLGGSRYRVFFSSRDDSNRSHVGWFEIDLERPGTIEAVADQPVLVPGPLGHFDDHGVYAASAVQVGHRVYLYTIGWNPGVRAPLFYSSIGLAVSEDGGKTFVKSGRAPIMSRSDHDPCLVTSPWVLQERDHWRMWYVSGTAWQEGETGLSSVYHIKLAKSDDGIAWRRDGQVAIDHVHPRERNIARACVRRIPQGYEAWYSYNAGSGYRIGFATSKNGVSFTRHDSQAGLELSPDGWDSQATAYPAVVEWAGQRFMFYNGNGFGCDGIGLARSVI